MKNIALFTILLLLQIILTNSQNGNVFQHSDSSGWNWGSSNREGPDHVHKLGEKTNQDTLSNTHTSINFRSSQNNISTFERDNPLRLAVPSSFIANDTEEAIGRNARNLKVDDISLSGGEREGRILNKGLSFIPILSASNDEHEEKDYRTKSFAGSQNLNNPYSSDVYVNTQSSQDSHDYSFPYDSDTKELSLFHLQNNQQGGQEDSHSQLEGSPYFESISHQTKHQPLSSQSEVPYGTNSYLTSSNYQASKDYSPNAGVQGSTVFASKNEHESSQQYPILPTGERDYQTQTSHSSHIDNFGVPLRGEERYSIKNYPNINRPSKSIDDSQEKYNSAASGYEEQPFTKETCVCVPFYLCSNGYLVNYQGDRSGDYAQLIDERSNISPETLNLTELAVPQKNYEKSKNRTTRAVGNETHDSPYVDITPRIGPFNQDGCGFLRTCCQILPSVVPGSFIPSTHPGAFGFQFIDHQAGVYPDAGQSFFGQQLVPQSNFDSGLGESYLQGQQIHPGVLTSGDYLGSIIPPNILPDTAHAQGHLAPGLSSLGIPHVIDTSGTKPGYEFPNPIGHLTCGKRNAFGIHGRVQNLHYHDDSTEFGEYPWQVAVLRKIAPKDSLYVCGGVLIDSQWVITAAHCLRKFQKGDLKVRLGEWDVHREDEFYPFIEKYIKEVHVHPRFYPGNLKNDIALLLLDSPVALTFPHISPACLPDFRDHFGNQRCWVSGWGKDGFGALGEYQNVLREVDLPIVGFKDCEIRLQHTRLGPGFRLHPGFLCAGGEPGKDACEGDGGSPLVCENQNGVWKVVGLVSWGIGCGQPGVPGIYVNVAHYVSWIESFVNRYG
ncbi:uncharacterized protein LOC143238626 isoform X2 [Tachypleus tridentatus]|uniref:uncharacterized protein LOC143238626 isoform X2 n=1 Tax=Tachypleus tridentatus TaxID=6853 RepID=UPI003FD41DC0